MTQSPVVPVPLQHEAETLFESELGGVAEIAHSGRLDVFWEFGLNPWDMAAGILLVTEAGGKVSDMNGAPHRIPASRHILADNGAIHEDVLALFAEIFHGHFRQPIPAIL